MIEVKPYQASSWPPKLLRQAHEDFSALTDEWLIYQSFVAEQGWAWMAVEGDTPLAAAGAYLVWPGVAHGWVIILDQEPQIMTALMRKLKRMLPEFCKLHRIRRLQTVIKSTPETGRLARFCGLEQEAPLPGYGVNGDEWHLYGRVM